MERGEEELPNAGATLPPSPAPSKAPSQTPTTAATTPPPPPSQEQQQQQQQRRSRPLSRGSLESTLADLDGVVKGVDVRAGGSWEPEPENPLRQPYWLMRLVRQTVRPGGGFITAKLHVPGLVWQMDRASFAGLSVKTRAFEACLILLLDRVLPLEKPRGPQDGALARQALQAFATVRAEFDQLQNQLSRPFPFIRRTTTSAAGAASEGAAEALAGDGGGGGSGGGGGLNQVQQRLSSMVMSIGKTVKKSAVSAYTAYERIGVAVPSKISDDELVAYSSLVHEVCDKAQSLDAWFLHLSELRAAGGGGGSDAAGAFQQVVEQALVELLHCARFLQEVVVELLLRDVSSLLEVYLRKMRKSFSRMTYDLEDEDDD